MRTSMSRSAFFAASAIAFAWTASAAAATPVEQLNALADKFVGEVVAYDPTIAYFTGLPTKDHDRFVDRTPEALAAWDAREAADLKALRAIDADTLPAGPRAAYAVLKEQMEADLQLRVCKT